MAFTPISNTVPQYEEDGVAASGFYIKFYEAGTTTPTAMATDSTGATTLDKCELNTEGYPKNGSNAVFIPHIDRRYKIALFRNATDADNNNLNNAVWPVDNMEPVLTKGSGEVATIADLRSVEPEFDGQQISLLGHTLPGIGGGEFYYDASDSGLDNNGTLIVTTGGKRWKRPKSEFVDISWFGAIGIGDESEIIQTAINTGKSIDFRSIPTMGAKNLVWSKSNTVYTGPCKIILPDGANTNISSIAEGVINVTFKNLEFDGNGVNQTVLTEQSNGIVLGDVLSGITFSECYFHDYGNPIIQPPNPNVSSDYNSGDGVVSFNNNVGSIENVLFEKCDFNNCYAGIAIRADGKNLRVVNCTFKHHADNSIKTRTGMDGIVVENCRDEDTRGAECWGVNLRYVNNYSINSHRHGVSGGLKACYISGNTFEHNIQGLDSLYAIEIGLSEECRVIGNRIVGWEGQAAVRMTDAAQASKNTLVNSNSVIGGSYSVGAIGSSNIQDNCIYSDNILIDIVGAALSVRGNNQIITDNIVKDSSASLAEATTTVCLTIPSGEQHIIKGNSFSLAGKWITGDSFLNVMSGGGLIESIIEGNFLFGGRNTINGGLTNSIIQGNIIKAVEKVINSDAGSQGGVFKDNILINATTLLDSGNYSGFSADIRTTQTVSSIPTTGDWRQGDEIRYINVSAGGKFGAVCVASGTPGTWKEYGTVDA